ncbi:MAG TPA: GTPase HflX, partial [Burkholderiales bacterium]|nr:GTPase HflX [Burkholderiales bacterium]
MVYNKIDAAGLEAGVERDQYGKIAAVRVSARNGSGVDFLRSLLGELQEAHRSAKGLAAA